MKKRSNMIRNLLSALFACLVCTSGAYAAVAEPQLDVQGGSVASDGTTLSISAQVIAIITGGTPNPIPSEAFSLSATLATGAGSLTAGTLLSATFSNFMLVDMGFGFGTFSADLSYTGGSLQGGLTSGRIEGAISNAIPGVSNTVPFTADTVTAKVGPVVVPVPAAVWLFGSGLIGLVSLARRKTGS